MESGSTTRSDLIDTQYPTDDYRTIKIDIPAGRQLMNGVTAVEYARTRHPDSDYGRENRQQQVLLAIRDRALQLDVLPRLPQILPEVRDLVSTDISLVEAVQLANFGRSLDASQIVRLRPDPSLTPSYVGYGGASYINLTPAYRKMVRAMVESTDPSIVAEQAAISVLQRGGAGWLGQSRRGPAGRGRPGGQSNRDRAARDDDAHRSRRRRQHSAELVAHVLGLSADALTVEGDSTDVKVLLGPDLELPRGRVAQRQQDACVVVGARWLQILSPRRWPKSSVKGHAP